MADQGVEAESDGHFAMTDDNCQPVAWNEQARISCEFSFQCSKTWECLTPTDNASIRRCQECNRDVHLALTEEDFRRHAEGGYCIAVRVLQINVPDENRKDVFIVGSTDVSYNAHLKPL